VDDNASKRVMGGFTMIDLAAYANAALRDERANDGKGGWSDQGDNDLRHFPTGEQLFRGVPFLIADPAKNDGKAALSVLSYRSLIPYPKEIKGIPLGNKLYSRVYFLHTAAWATGKLATYRFRYAKINEIAQGIEISRGDRVGDWWRLNPGPRCKVAWKERAAPKTPWLST